ncbi:flagellar hook-length control protein FliK [Rhodospirillaceae bacterium SYSU D60014]|uniref:flagellar hook-length control protein FliK n=1 Tax=Virgifigura deserti TaxID=2268457 RepID=UPI000E66F03D
MDALAFEPAFVGGRTTPPRTSPGTPPSGARPFEDFLPRDDVSSPAPADKPRRSDTERPPATAERPDTGPRTDRPDDRSEDRDDARSADAADAAAPAVAAPPPAKGPADLSGTAAGNSEEATTAKPALPHTGAAPSGQAATAPTAAAQAAATPTAERAPNPNMPGETAAATQAAATLAKPTPGSGKTTAQPQISPTPADGADPTSPALPSDAAESGADALASASNKTGPATGAATRVAAQQIGDATRSTTGDSGSNLHAGARNGLSAQSAQGGAQEPPALAGPAVAQAMDSSGEPGGSPDALSFAAIGDGDLSSASTGQSLAGTPSTPTQAAHGATAAAGHRPVPTPPMLAEQIAVHIQRGIEQGTDRIDIRLTPAELGRIEVRLELGHDGRVHASIAVDRAETLDLLQRDSRSLERALQDAGLKTDSGGLTFNLRGDGRQHSNTGFAANEALADSGPERSEPDIVADTSERRIHLDGVVDIRV